MQDTVDVVRNGMPSKTFSEMMAVLRKFVSFMNLTVRGLLYSCVISLCIQRAELLVAPLCVLSSRLFCLCAWHSAS